MMKATQRLFLNADRTKCVAEDHKDAAFLYATPGDEIPDEAAERFGLVDGALPEAKAKSGGSTKEKTPAKNKEKPAGGDKSGGNEPPKPPQLTDIAGIGPATAEALGKAGVTDVAALAAVDPSAAPEVDKLPPNFDWATTVTAAKALAAPAGNA